MVIFQRFSNDSPTFYSISISYPVLYHSRSRQSFLLLSLFGPPDFFNFCFFFFAELHLLSEISFPPPPPPPSFLLVFLCPLL